MRRCVQTLTGSVPGNAEHSLVSGAYKSQDWCQAGRPLGSMAPTPVLSSSLRGFTRPPWSSTTLLYKFPRAIKPPPQKSHSVMSSSAHAENY